MKILVAYDGSAPADAAIRDLAQAGLPPAGEALVLTVADVFVPPDDRAENIKPYRELEKVMEKAHAEQSGKIKEAQELAEHAVNNLRDILPNWQLGALGQAGQPGWTIIQHAEENQIDLVVTGAHGLSLWDRALLGSISAQVLTHAHCSVRIGRAPAESNNTTQQLLIGLDGSAEAAYAARWVAGRHWPPGTRVHIVSVFDSRHSNLLRPLLGQEQETPHEGEQDELGWLKHISDTTAQMLAGAGLEPTLLVKQGDPKQILLEQAEAHKAGCIFLGARGLGGWERLLLGSVSTAVATHARCSVEVVRKSG